MTTSRRPACPGITLEGTLKPRHLAGYLTGAVGTAAMLAAPQAEAAVTAVTFDFGTSYNILDTTGGYYWPVNGGTLGTLKGFVNSNYLVIGGGNAFTGAVYHNGVYGHLGLMSFFADGTVIGTGANGTNIGGAHSQALYSAIDFTSDQLNKNIGFKTSSNNWGWANVSWTEADKTLTFHSAFVESVAGNSITVGATAVPEPSSTLLALAGLGGAARRRRKVAA